jgi:hypothetical protein
VEAVRGGENDFGYGLTTFNYQGGSKQILQIVRKLTELAEPARSGIAFKCVHGAPHASQRVRVPRIGLEKDPCFVQLLQQILRALKKKFAKFCGAFIGKKVQPATSMR